MNNEEKIQNQFSESFKGSILELLNNDNFRMYNIFIAKLLKSVNASIMLHELCQRFEWHKRRGELIETEKHSGKWFYYTAETGEERTGLSEKEQRVAVSILEDFGIINKIILGVPGKKHFQINIDKLLEILANSKNNSRTAKKPDWPKNDMNEESSENTEKEPPQGSFVQNCQKAKLEPPKGQRDIYKEREEDDDERQSERDDFSPSKEISSISDVFSFSIRKKKDWTTEEIEHAWKKYKESKAPISDAYNYIETIIKNKRILKLKTEEKKSCKKTQTNQEKSQPENNSTKLLDTDKGFYLGKDTSESTLAKYARQNGLR